MQVAVFILNLVRITPLKLLETAFDNPIEKVHFCAFLHLGQAL